MVLNVCEMRYSSDPEEWGWKKVSSTGLDTVKVTKEPEPLTLLLLIACVFSCGCRYVELNYSIICKN